MIIILCQTLYLFTILTVRVMTDMVEHISILSSAGMQTRRPNRNVSMKKSLPGQLKFLLMSVPFNVLICELLFLPKYLIIVKEVILNFNVLVISEKHVPNCDQNCILPSTISKQWDQNSTKVSVHHSLKQSVSLTLKVIVKNINLYCSQIWISFETILLYFIALENRFNMIYGII